MIHHCCHHRSDPDNSSVRTYYRKIKEIDEKKSEGTVRGGGVMGMVMMIMMIMSVMMRSVMMMSVILMMVIVMMIV